MPTSRSVIRISIEPTLHTPISSNPCRAAARHAASSAGAVGRAPSSAPRAKIAAPAAHAR
ncbi:hypothetical protein A5714_13375 [Mycobacterium sp. E2462]|nr:hypothetical protein A5714_13375 [Mycobacterium sp. E2462]